MDFRHNGDKVSETNAHQIEDRAKIGWHRVCFGETFCYYLSDEDSLEYGNSQSDSLDVL